MLHTLYPTWDFNTFCNTQLYNIAEGMLVMSPCCNSNIADISSSEWEKKKKSAAYDLRRVKISWSPSFFPYWIANQPIIEKYITKKQACLKRAIFIACGSILGTQMWGNHDFIWCISLIKLMEIKDIKKPVTTPANTSNLQYLALLMLDNQDSNNFVDLTF